MSIAAAQHGVARRKQGYTAAMLVEESGMLQVTILPDIAEQSGQHRFQRAVNRSDDDRRRGRFTT
jgi:hypothetical protein